MLIIATEDFSEVLLMGDQSVVAAYKRVMERWEEAVVTRAFHPRSNAPWEWRRWAAGEFESCCTKDQLGMVDVKLYGGMAVWNTRHVMRDVAATLYPGISFHKLGKRREAAVVAHPEVREELNLRKTRLEVALREVLAIAPEEV